ncbi:unnamed protein product [Phytophthora lilii]|uniref:Unnamed protein product n=1 Tax=Phytophthora lilii TaxID=2077276 RepID=A0A9W6TFZ4_9STRA|nr:unnamed protein product [Phytophthora lilii]
MVERVDGAANELLGNGDSATMHQTGASLSMATDTSRKELAALQMQLFGLKRYLTGMTDEILRLRTEMQRENAKLLDGTRRNAAQPVVGSRAKNVANQNVPARSECSDQSGNQSGHQQVGRLSKRPRDLYELWHEYEFGMAVLSQQKSLLQASEVHVSPFIAGASVFGMFFSFPANLFSAAWHRKSCFLIRYDLIPHSKCHSTIYSPAHKSSAPSLMRLASILVAAAVVTLVTKCNALHTAAGIGGAELSDVATIDFVHLRDCPVQIYSTPKKKLKEALGDAKYAKRLFARWKRFGYDFDKTSLRKFPSRLKKEKDFQILYKQYAVWLDTHHPLQAVPGDAKKMFDIAKLDKAMGDATYANALFGRWKPWV